MIISPCISICKTDPTTGYCYGCGRNNEEKKTWKLEETTDDWKSNNLEEIKKRLIKRNQNTEQEVNNRFNAFDEDVKHCLSNKFIALTKAQPAIAFNNRRVIFFVTPTFVIIELVEEVS